MAQSFSKSFKTRRISSLSSAIVQVSVDLERAIDFDTRWCLKNQSASHFQSLMKIMEVIFKLWLPSSSDSEDDFHPVSQNINVNNNFFLQNYTHLDDNTRKSSTEPLTLEPTSTKRLRSDVVQDILWTTFLTFRW